MDIGDLMGAIHGVRYVGFIGDVYRRFPFPQSEADFKQKPEGFQNRSIVEPILDTYTRIVTISFHAEREHNTMAIGPYLFTREVFQQLINYVWLGGYPQWRGGIRPDHVFDMRKELERSSSWIFAGLHFP